MTSTRCTARLSRLLRAAPLALAFVLAACGGGSSSGGTGSLRLALTDAPACGYDQVNVTVEKVRVHQTASAGEADAGWSEIVLPAPRRLDLLRLVNGALEELGQTALPAGKYTQMRLVLGSNGGSTPLANSVVPTATGTEVPLDTPSGQQSGLKTNVNIDVEAGKMADFLIDFQVCKSVVKRGNSGQYNLKPVLAVLPRLMDAGARVVGYLATSMAGATVSVQSAGGPVRATVPDPTTGRFDLYPMASGSYTLVISGAGRVTAVMTGVPVVENSYTFVNAVSSPIDLPTGAPRTIHGVVSASAAVTPIHAFVRAAQALTGGPTVEVAEVPVDLPSGGMYSLAVSSAPPVRAAYVAGASAVSFITDDSGLLGISRYTAEARVTQAAPAPTLIKTSIVNLSAGVLDPLPAVDFAFP